MKNNKLIEKNLRDKLNEAAQLNEENEGIMRESATAKILRRNDERIKQLIEQIDGLMALRDDPQPISSDDGTFTAYKKVIGMSGVDMEKVMATGLMAWFIQYHPECLVLDLRKAQAVLGCDLSGYAKRQAYAMYTVSKDEDYRYVAELLSDYHDEMAEKENE